jgi:hypothetical protein
VDWKRFVHPVECYKILDNTKKIIFHIFKVRVQEPMSEIDQYKHKCLGILECPTAFIENDEDHIQKIALYRVDEPAEEWDAKAGDILLGGGGGEVDVFRVSIPEAFIWTTSTDHSANLDYDDVYKEYWCADSAYVFGVGYRKLGWKINMSMEAWLLDHIVAFLLREYPEEYGKFRGTEELGQDGTILRLPIPGTIEEEL